MLAKYPVCTIRRRFAIVPYACIAMCDGWQQNSTIQCPGLAQKHALKCITFRAIANMHQHDLQSMRARGVSQAIIAISSESIKLVLGCRMTAHSETFPR